MSTAEHPDMRAPFRLITGEVVDILALRKDQIPIDVIAHGLSLLKRYGGQTPWGYAVGLHSVMVSYLVPAPLAYEGLMHDYTEALALVDVPSPIKKFCEDYRRIEAYVRKSTHTYFDLALDEPAEIKHVDRYTARKLEQAFLQNVFPLPDDITDEHVQIARPFLERPWADHEVKARFLARYAELRAGLN